MVPREQSLLTLPISPALTSRLTFDIFKWSILITIGCVALQFGTDIYSAQTSGSYLLWGSPDYSYGNIMMVTFVFLEKCWMGCRESWSHTHVPLRVKCNDFGDPLISHLASSPGLYFN